MDDEPHQLYQVCDFWIKNGGTMALVFVLSAELMGACGSYLSGS